MNKHELNIQREAVKIFELINSELPKINSEVNKLGWAQRNALVSHVYSGYQQHEELNEAKTKWEKMMLTSNVHDWLFKLMRKHRDLYGYFENYKEMISELDSILDYAIETQEYEIAEILSSYRKQLLDPV